MIHTVGMSSSTAMGIVWSQIAKVPIIIELVTKESTPFQNLPLLHFFWKPELKYQTVIVAISSALGDKCRELGLSNNVWIRPNPVNTVKYNVRYEEKYKLREKNTPFNKDDVVLVSISKFMPSKNQLFLIDVVNKLPDKYKLILAGPLVSEGAFVKRDKMYFEEIVEKIKEYDIGSRVFLKTGFVQADEYINASDIYLLPNIQEGLATPMLESIACGVPVIANKSEQAFKEWISDGKNGYLCELNIEDWVSNILNINSITKEDIVSSSNSIREKAGHEKIDSIYNKLIHVLKNSEVNEIISIDNHV